MVINKIRKLKEKIKQNKKNKYILVKQIEMKNTEELNYAKNNKQV